MIESYTNKYLQIYLYQILSVLLGFASLFVVIPFLSSNPTIYGIYTVCISINIFLSYADLGFLSAAQKYAAESYSRTETNEELSLLGFAHFILFLMVILISIFFFYLSFDPTVLFSGLEGPEEVLIARNLLLIQSLFAPIIVLQRLAQMIFSIRLEDYVIQRFVILGNIFKILSVFYFFTNSRYDIIGYYLFIQVVSLIVAIFCLYLAKIKYSILLCDLFKQFKFSIVMYKKTKKLAFSSFFVTIAWILYYELDSIVIGKLVGTHEVALYAVGFTLLGFLRSLLSILYSPFLTRFNYFKGLSQLSEFKLFYAHVIKITFPLVVFPLITIVGLSRPFIISWVGYDYSESVNICKWLMLCNVLGFVSYPAGMMLIANERISQMYLLSAITVLFFWIGVSCTIEMWGVVSFAFFKFASFFINGIIYIYISSKYLSISVLDFVRKVIMPYLPGVFLLFLYVYFLNDCFIAGKNYFYLFVNGVLIFVGICAASIVSLLFAKDFRYYTFGLIKTVFNK